LPNLGTAEHVILFCVDRFGAFFLQDVTFFAEDKVLVFVISVKNAKMVQL